MNNQTSKIKVHQQIFSRNKTNWKVFCKEKSKMYSLVYDKRCIVDNLNTIPFGY